MSTKTTPCANPKCPGPSRPHGWQYQTPRLVKESERNQVTQPARGRPKKFCSNTCRHAAFIDERKATEREREQRATELRHQRRLDEAERIAMTVINDYASSTSTRIPTTVRKSLAETLIRQLHLSRMIDVDRFW